MTEKVQVVKDIQVPSDKVWAAIRAISGLDKWFPMIATCSVEGDGVGAIRTCGLGDGAALTERIEEINDETKRFRYAITDSPLPISDHMGTVDVRATGERKTQITWTAEFSVGADHRDEMVGMMNGALSDGIDGLERELKG